MDCEFSRCCAQGPTIQLKQVRMPEGWTGCLVKLNPSSCVQSSTGCRRLERLPELPCEQIHALVRQRRSTSMQGNRPGEPWRLGAPFADNRLRRDCNPNVAFSPRTFPCAVRPRCRACGLESRQGHKSRIRPRSSLRLASLQTCRPARWSRDVNRCAMRANRSAMK